jgi:hypothetical protein
MAKRSTVRASDADREQVADRLREASVEGRLLAEELEDRLARAFRARTYGDLDPLVADLPRQLVPRRRLTFSLILLRVMMALALLVMAAVVLVVAVFLITGLLTMWGIWLLLGWWFFGRHGQSWGPRRVPWSRYQHYGPRGIQGARRAYGAYRAYGGGRRA